MVHVVVCCRAATRAVELRPALLALRTRIDVHAGKLLRDVHIEGLVEHTALLELILADKLVAGIDIAVRRYGYILIARAAAA